MLSVIVALKYKSIYKYEHLRVSFKVDIILILYNVKDLKLHRKFRLGNISNNFVKISYKLYIAVTSVRSGKGKINIY